MNLRKNINNIRFIFSVTFLLGIILWSSSPAIAQRDVQITHHMFNRTYYNPAATGASNYINTFLLARNQWVGWDGAPKTQIATVHSYFPGIKSGLGLNLINDKTGFEQMFIGKAMYAYHLMLSPDSYLSMGLGAGIHYQSVDFNEQNPIDPTDPNLVWDRQHKYNPDFDFGLEYNLKRLKVGVSVTHLNRPANNDNSVTTGMHFYGYVRYDIPVSFSWMLTPSFFTQNSKGSTHLEAGVLANYQRLFWFGTFFRMDDKADPETCAFMAGANIFKSIKVGYSFDLNLHRLKGYTHNSHEVFLLLQLPYNNSKYDKTPRFFE